jgi:hypothetical protein
VAVLGSAAFTAPALAGDRKPREVSLAIEAGSVKLSADVRSSTSSDSGVSVTATAPDVSASATVEPSAGAVSLDVSTPVASASVAADTGTDPAVDAAAPSAPIAPTIHLPERKTRAPARVPIETVAADPAVGAPTAAATRFAARPVHAAEPGSVAPAALVASRPARSPAVSSTDRLIEHAATRGSSVHQADAVRTSREGHVFATTPEPAAGLVAGGRPPRQSASAERLDAVGNAFDLFGWSDEAQLGAVSAAVLLFVLLATFWLAAPRIGLWPRPVADLALQPALPSLLERPG